MISHHDIKIELLRRLADRSLSGKAVASLLGIAPARVSEIKIGKRRIQPDEMATLARYLGLDDFSDPAAWSRTSRLRETRAPNLSPSVHAVPVIGAASAGSWREAVTFPNYGATVRRGEESSMAFAVEVAGDSMNKVMAEGSWAVVDPGQTQLFDGRVYLIANHEFDATIKRYRSNPPRFEPDSHNLEHRPIIMDQHNIRVIGRVVSYGGDLGL